MLCSMLDDSNGIALNLTSISTPLLKRDVFLDFGKFKNVKLVAVVAVAVVHAVLFVSLPYAV